jgi:hypothetical protein
VEAKLSSSKHRGNATTKQPKDTKSKVLAPGHCSEIAECPLLTQSPVELEDDDPPAVTFVSFFWLKVNHLDLAQSLAAVSLVFLPA